MIRHLSSAELVDAADGQFASTRRRRHVACCDRCQSRVVELRGVLARAAAGGDVPEPSPLFWDHLSQRVRAATQASAPPRAAWWSDWRPIAGVSAVMVALLLAVGVRQHPSAIDQPRAARTDARQAAAPAAGAEDPALNVVAQLTSSVSFDELRLAVEPTPDATDAMLAQLSPAERQELARLIEAEKGSSE